MSNDWILSSSDEDDDQSLLQSKPKTYFANPKRIKNKESPYQFLKNEHSLVSVDEARQMQNSVNSNRKRKIEADFQAIPLKKSDHFKDTIYDPLKVWEYASTKPFFMSTCQGIERHYNYLNPGHQANFPVSLGIKDILSDKFGVLVKSAQFNYCFDILWLIEQYPERDRSKPLLIIHGEQKSGNKQIQNEASLFNNITLCRVDLPPFGTHHTKMMLLLYENGLRVVILTANMVPQDWDKKTQGFYFSPMFPILNKNSVANKKSEFQNDLIHYLHSYHKKELNNWLEVIQNCDMSNTNGVRLVGSVPGRHSGLSLSDWGHMRLRNLLKNSVKRIDSSWPVVAQFSSIGSLGANQDKWLCSEWLTSMSACNPGKIASSSLPPLFLIFPTVDNVRCSLEGYPAGASLPYSAANAAKQPWLKTFLHQWKADNAGRTYASPHIKTYARISPYESNVRLPWFLLTSANLSKAAWGVLEKKSTQLAIRSYELGVLFLPHQKGGINSEKLSFNEHLFHLVSDRDSYNKFSLPFSWPLTPYTAEDSPWIWDIPHTDKPDRHGNIWKPS